MDFREIDELKKKKIIIIERIETYDRKRIESLFDLYNVIYVLKY